MNSRRWSIALCPSTLFALVFATGLTLAFLSQQASGQQTLGSLNGTVTDVSGAVVQNATVKIRNVATNLEVTAESKNDGSFSFADLPIGTMRLLLRRMDSRPPSITKFWCRAVGPPRSTPNFSLAQWPRRLPSKPHRCSMRPTQPTAIRWAQTRLNPFPWAREVLRSLPFRRPALARISSRVRDRTKVWAIRESSPTANGIPATCSLLTE